MGKKPGATGEWIPAIDRTGFDTYRCSVCGRMALCGWRCTQYEVGTVREAGEGVFVPVLIPVEECVSRAAAKTPFCPHCGAGMANGNEDA